jgi:hypothetical protein
MHRADHAGLVIGQQDGHAIGGQHAECNAGCRGNQRIGAAGMAFDRGRDGDDIRRMHLIRADQGTGRHVERMRHPGAVDRDDIGLIRRAGAAVESLEHP